MPKRAIKLSVLGKYQSILPVPGQDPAKSYAVVWNGCRQPEGGWGYLMEMTGKREGMLLAWLDAGNCAYACDEPLAARPARTPDLVLSGPVGRGDGSVLIRSTAGSDMLPVGGYEVSAGATGTLLRFRDSYMEIGPYDQGFYDVRTFLGVSFLAYVHLPRERASQAGDAATIAGILEDALPPALPLPDVLDAFALRPYDSASVSGFERYASEALLAAGARRIRPIAARHDLRLGLIWLTGLSWIHVYDELDDQEMATVLAVEGALNRLRLIGLAARAIDGAGMASLFDEGACCIEDWRCIRSICQSILEVARKGDEGYGLSELYGHSCAKGGEWDVRMRFASAVERLALPFRMGYSFDCDAASGIFAIRCSLPDAEAFPDRWFVRSSHGASGARGDGARGTWTDVSENRNWARSAYAVRLSALLAACAFTSSVGIMKAVVSASGPAARETDEVELSMSFDRLSFMPVCTTGPRLDEIASEELTWDAPSLINLVRPVECHVAFDASGALRLVDPVDVDLGARRVDIAVDDRPIPEEAKNLLHADKVRDLDIFLETDEERLAKARVWEAVQDAEDSPLVASALLEEILDQAPVNLEDGRTPLYCQDLAGREIVGLMTSNDGERFVNVPDSVYDATLHLSRIYRSMGDAEGSIGRAEALVSMSPSTVRSYLELVNAVVEAGDFQRSEEILRKAIAVCVSAEERQVVKYRLAFALWQNGKLDHALALYQTVGSQGPVAGAAREEMRELMGEMGREEVFPERERDAVLRRAGLRDIPPQEAVSRIVGAAIALLDANLILPAHALVSVLAEFSGSDVIFSVARSLVSTFERAHGQGDSDTAAADAPAADAVGEGLGDRDDSVAGG